MKGRGIPGENIDLGHLKMLGGSSRMKLQFIDMG